MASSGGSVFNPELSERSFSLWLAGLSQLFLLLFLYGFVRVLYAVYLASQWVNVYLTRSSTLPRYLHGRKWTAWALVTGATEGIGTACVRQLAAQGFNVILHGRDAAKLDRMTRDLRQRNLQASFRSIVVDAAAPSLTDSIRAAADSLADLPGPLTVLVNNLGGTASLWPEVFKPFADLSVAQLDGVLDLNVRFQTQLTAALLPRLVRSKPSLILTAGSAVGEHGMPYAAAYGATKAYGARLSAALGRELAAEGHDVECLTVVYGRTTDTATVRDKESFLLPSAETAVAGALHKVGCGRAAVAACVGHWAAMVVLDVLPEWAGDALLKSVAVAGRAKEQKALKKR